MCRVVDQVGDFKILTTSRGYVVKNINGSYDNHGHFRKLGTCYKIIKMVQRKQVPNSKYLRESAIRLSLDTRYTDRVKRKIAKDRDKPRYYNSQKGVRR